MTRERNVLRPKPQEFHSMEERDRWQIATYGQVRNAFREADEPPDERPVISRRPFWTDDSEREAYEHVVQSNPRRLNDGPGTYIARLASIAQGRVVPKWPGVQTVPRGREVKGEVQRMTQAQIDARVAELEGQRPSIGTGEIVE